MRRPIYGPYSEKVISYLALKRDTDQGENSELLSVLANPFGDPLHIARVKTFRPAINEFRLFTDGSVFKTRGAGGLGAS